MQKKNLNSNKKGMLSACKSEIRGVPRIGRGKQRKGKYANHGGASSNNKRGVKKINQVLKKSDKKTKNVKGVLSTGKWEIKRRTQYRKVGRRFTS